MKARRRVSTETLFLAGSVSKPVTAIAAIDLVERGKLPLDADVNTLLRSWQLPSNELTAKTPVTLRQLLSHSAGTTVHGFPGYPRSEAVPTTRQVLDGPGRYKQAPDRILTIRRSGDALELRTIDGRWVKLHSLEDGTLTRTDADQRFRITAEGVDIITGTTVAAARTTEPPSPVGADRRGTPR